MEETRCKIIYGAPTTLALKGLMMMMMMMIDHRAESACQRSRSARGHKQKTLAAGLVHQTAGGCILAVSYPCRRNIVVGDK